MNRSINLFLFLFSFSLLPNILIKTNNYFKLTFLVHPNTKVQIIKSISIQGKIEMETKYSFSFFILIYQICPKVSLILESLTKKINQFLALFKITMLPWNFSFNKNDDNIFHILFRWKAQQNRLFMFSIMENDLLSIYVSTIAL